MIDYLPILPPGGNRSAALELLSTLLPDRMHGDGMDYEASRSAVEKNLLPNIKLFDEKNSGACAGGESYDRPVSHIPMPNID